jgi:hypothetical protein
MKKLWLYIFPTMAVLSCQTVIDVDLPKHEPLIVLNAYLIAGDSLPNNISDFTSSYSTTVMLSKSQGAFDPPTAPIIASRAIQIIENNQQTIFDDQVPSQPLDIDRWQLSTLELASGNTYHVEASVSGLPGPAIGTQTIPLNATILDASVIAITGEQVRVRIQIQDPPGPNRYLIRAYQIDDFSGQPFFSEVPFNVLDPAFSALDLFEDNDFEGLNFGSLQGLITDDTFDGMDKEFEFRITSWSNSQTFVIEWMSITPEFERFLRTFYQNQRSAFNPFAEPANVFMNVRNGYGAVLGGHRRVINIQR